MIGLYELTKTFGDTRVLNGLSFEVRTGEAVALWGPNGTGKTTALKCLLGLYAFQGRAVIAGTDVARQGKTARAAVGYVPQELAFYDMSALETVRFYGGLKKVSRERAAEVLETVGLTEHGAKLVAQLSGGMKQRLALAIALLADPPALLLDEPTSNLDAAGREAFIRLLVAQKAAGKTILFSSHRLEELEALADRVLVLQDGCLAFECGPHEVAARLGLTMHLKLHLPLEQHAQALAVLASDGYAASPNGRGIWVVVAPTAKAAPIRTLEQAGIGVTDFEVAPAVVEG
ncbi:MAG: ABC transporter ATP-binding protein [Ardenticatenaceae bacterium]|nr:ABC transporter ATP-binding protein [Ardenticatenaceae bacterium]HBY97485.1 ABC transporter ATP-binding protein [Chloroflexota bacterium]